MILPRWGHTTSMVLFALAMLPTPLVAAFAHPPVVARSGSTTTRNAPTSTRAWDTQYFSSLVPPTTLPLMQDDSAPPASRWTTRAGAAHRLKRAARMLQSLVRKFLAVVFSIRWTGFNLNSVKDAATTQSVTPPSGQDTMVPISLVRSTAEMKGDTLQSSLKERQPASSITNSKSAEVSKELGRKLLEKSTTSVKTVKTSAVDDDKSLTTVSSKGTLDLDTQHEDLEDRAFAILVDLGLVQVEPPVHQRRNDDDVYPDQIYL